MNYGWLTISVVGPCSSPIYLLFKLSCLRIELVNRFDDYIKIFINFFRSYVNTSGPGFALHSQIVLPYIYKYGTPEQIERLVPDLVSGKKIGAIAMTEPGAGR